MASPGSDDSISPALSVVIPSYNSAEWLPSTIGALADAVREAGAPTELVVVDDGSSDGTPEAVDRAAVSFPGSVRVLTQSNKGRFLARWEGITHAGADLVMLLDSRVLVHRGAIRHVLEEISKDPARVAWNASVVTDPKAPLVGLFWEVPTHVFWGRYLRSPRPFDLTPENFDQAPKGTTMFLARRDVLTDAFEHAWPRGDAKLVSDDTKVLRRIAQTSTIRLDPAFSATYRPRTTVRGFITHTFDRGTLFVDSYAGTTGLRSAIILLLAVLPVAMTAAVVALIIAGYPAIAWAICIGLVLTCLLPALVAAWNRCPARALWAFVVCLPVFVIPFWLGLVRGVIMHRGSFVQSAHHREGAQPGTEHR